MNASKVPSENYFSTGQLKESETGILVGQLPKPLRDYLSLHHKGMKVKEAAKIIKANGQVQYEAEIGGKDLIFDEKGNPIK